MGLFSKKNEENGPDRSGAGTGMDMTPMVRMLASASEEQRQQMLSDRLAVFADQDEATRTRGMEAMLTAALSLPDDAYRNIVSSRLAVLLGLPQETRMTLMQTHAAVVKGLDEGQRQKEMRTMQTVVSGLPEGQREMVTGMMAKLGLTP